MSFDVVTDPVEIPIEISEEVSKVHPESQLFGSRYMAQYWPGDRLNLAENSDWDFAFPYKGSEYKEAQKMKSLGWVEKPRLKYLDKMSFAVYEKQIGNHNVQMCSKINMSVFIETWKRIDPVFYWTYLHKSSPLVLPKEAQTAVFNQMYKTYGW
jgi:hypothetical protein